MDEALVAPGVGVEKTTERMSDAEILRTVRENGANFFPGFPVLDTSEYDVYKPEEDQYNRGRLLYLTTEVGRGEGKPELRIVFRSDGFTFGASNTPEPEKTYTVRNVGDSFYGPKGRKWREDEMDLAMEYGRIRMEGVDTESDEFQNQLIGWSEEEGRFTTMKEVSQRYQEYLKEVKALKKAKQPIPSFNIIDSSKIRDLILARLSVGDNAFSQELAQRFATDEGFAHSTLRREINKLNAQMSMLSDRRKLPAVADAEIDYLEV